MVTLEFEMDRLLTQTEAAKVIGVDRVTVWRWVKSGKLPAERIVGGAYVVRNSVAIMARREREARLSRSGGKETRGGARIKPAS